MMFRPSCTFIMDIGLGWPFRQQSDPNRHWARIEVPFTERATCFTGHQDCAQGNKIVGGIRGWVFPGLEGKGPGWALGQWEPQRTVPSTRLGT